MLRRLVRGIGLPLRGTLFLLRHRRLWLLAVAPLLLNAGLYVVTLILFVRYYDVGFGLLIDRPEAWYWLIGYYVLRLLGFHTGYFRRANQIQQRIRHVNLHGCHFPDTSLS